MTQTEDIGNAAVYQLTAMGFASLLLGLAALILNQTGHFSDLLAAGVGFTLGGAGLTMVGKMAYSDLMVYRSDSSE